MIYYFIFAIIIISNVFAISDNGTVKIIQTQNGKVQGKKLLTAVEEVEYYSFKGIPFAQPPIGNLRFKAPQTAKPWDGVLDASKYKSKCAQLDFFTNMYDGSEDCLYINVFVPVTASNSDKLTTMLYIYGGAYQCGAAQFYGPDLLLNQNVIVVTFNYRVGPQGFLSLGTREFSGNMGLKDQKLAIQWVSDNIEYFGGDKEKITLFGESAGGSSTHFHVAVPESKKLFQRAIIQSGAVFNNWAYNIRSDDKSILSKYAIYNNDDINDFEKYIFDVDAERLAKFTYVPLFPAGKTSKTAYFNWAPIIEDKNAKDPFITEPIENLSKTNGYVNKLDTFFGFTSVEMLLFTIEEYINEKLLKPFDEKFEIQFPLRKNEPDFNSEEYKTLSDKVRTFYFGENGAVNKTSFPKYLDLLSDLWFAYGIDKAAKLQAKQSSGNTFLYKFSMESEMDFIKQMSGPVSQIPGASHGAELSFMFIVDFVSGLGEFYKNIEKGSKQHENIRFVTKLWTNFAKYGKPDPVIKPIQGDIINYVDITNDGIVSGIAPNKERVQFWDEVSKGVQMNENSKTEL